LAPLLLLLLLWWVPLGPGGLPAAAASSESDTPPPPAEALLDPQARLCIRLLPLAAESSLHWVASIADRLGGTSGCCRSTTNTVMLSRLPRSIAAVVSTLALTRHAADLLAPRDRARALLRSANATASWLLNTSHRPSLASSSSSSSGVRLKHITSGSGMT
jgi:hypothetical protein